PPSTDSNAHLNAPSPLPLRMGCCQCGRHCTGNSLLRGRLSRTNSGPGCRRGCPSHDLVHRISSAESGVRHQVPIQATVVVTFSFPGRFPSDVRPAFSHASLSIAATIAGVQTRAQNDPDHTAVFVLVRNTI